MGGIIELSWIQPRFQYRYSFSYQEEPDGERRGDEVYIYINMSPILWVCNESR